MVTCWERADILALVCDVSLRSCHFPIDILGHVWCLTVSSSDLFPLSYLQNCVSKNQRQVSTFFHKSAEIVLLLICSLLLFRKYCLFYASAAYTHIYAKIILSQKFIGFMVSNQTVHKAAVCSGSTLFAQ